MNTDKLINYFPKGIMRSIFTFYLKSDLYPRKSYSTGQEEYNVYRKQAEVFLKKRKKITTLESIKDISFMEPRNYYPDFKNLLSGEFATLVSGLDSFVEAVKDILKKEYREVFVYKKADRAISPSSEAYQKRPFNKMDIKESNDSYAALFYPYF